jgi:hypothetical protein
LCSRGGKVEAPQSLKVVSTGDARLVVAAQRQLALSRGGIKLPFNDPAQVLRAVDNFNDGGGRGTRDRASSP